MFKVNEVGSSSGPAEPMLDKVWEEVGEVVVVVVSWWFWEGVSSPI